MRKVTFGVANSLDHYIARPGGGVDWLVWSEDVSALTAAFWETIDTVVMGRKTYEAAKRLGQAGAYGGRKTYVCSRTLEARREPDVGISDDAVAFVRALKQEQEGGGICVLGGGRLAASLLEADLIDEIGLNIHPVLLGSGIPLFHPLPAQIDLELLECRVIRHGCVYLMYRVKR